MIRIRATYARVRDTFDRVRDIYEADFPECVIKNQLVT